MTTHKLAAFLLLGVLGVNAYAAIELYEFENKADEARFYALIEDFRCPTCQNQNLAGSDAPIAQDLKQKTYEMIKDGKTDGEIRSYMFERYGDFISYRPPVRPSTWILWFFPPVLLVFVLGVWLYKNRPKTPKESPKTDEMPLNQQEQQRLDQLLSSHQAAQDTPNRTKGDLL